MNKAGVNGTGAPALVSVIVGAYNHERYLRGCLDSIAANDYPNIEIIAFNDCSDDRTDAVMREWMASNPACDVTYLNHDVNMGFSRSLNDAIRHASGDYVCVIAADDVMLPAGIAVRVAYLDDHPGQLAVFGDAHVIDEAGRLTHDSAIEGLYGGIGMRKRHLEIETLLPYGVVFHWAVPGPVLMCRRSAYEEVGGYDERLLFEDWDMYLRLAMDGRLGFVDAHVANYRVHARNQTSLLQKEQKLKELVKTATKNSRGHNAITTMRLLAIRFQAQRQLQRSRPRRLAFAILTEPLLALSYRAYLIRRWLVMRRHG